MGYYEQYTCGCVSAPVARKRELLGYCPKHGHDRIGLHRTGIGDGLRQRKQLQERLESQEREGK